MTIGKNRRADIYNAVPGKIRYGWPLDSRDWDELETTDLQNATWFSKTITPGNVKSLPETEGVYMICAGPPISRSTNHSTELFQSFHEVLYVGETGNLRDRFYDYLSDLRPKIVALKKVYANTVRFWYTKLPNLTEAERHDYEAILMKCFGPPANERKENRSKAPVDVRRMIPVKELVREKI